MTSPAINLRNRLLAVLLRDAGHPDEMFLVRCDERAALMVADDKTQFLIVTVDGPGNPSGDLEVDQDFRARLRALIDAQPMGILHVLVVGGGKSVATALAEAARNAPDPTNLGVHHLDPDGRLAHLAGRRFAPLQAAVPGMDGVAPLDDAALQAAIEGARRHQAEALQFAASATGRFPVVSAILGAVCVSIYMAGSANSAGPFGAALVDMGAVSGAGVREGQIWRLLSSVFLHGSTAHLLTNMMSLYFLGTFLERAVGWARTLIIYGASALGGSIASAWLSVHPTIGASGAIWGLMLAGYGLALRPRGVLPGVIAARLKRALAVPLILNTGFSFLPGIGLQAHFGGGAVGIALIMSGVLFPPASTAEPVKGRFDGAPPASVVIKAIALVFAVALGASIAVAVWVTRSTLLAITGV